MEGDKCSFSKVIGLLISSFLAIRYAQLHTRNLEIYKTQHVTTLQSYDKFIPLSNKIRSELIWWRDNIHEYNGRSISEILGLDSWKFEIYTDASNVGWGATLYQAGKCISKIGGRWLNREKQRHINFLELQSIQFALFAFRTFVTNCYVSVHCDNTTAMLYINNFGGYRNSLLNYLSRMIMHYQ